MGGQVVDRQVVGVLGGARHGQGGSSLLILQRVELRVGHLDKLLVVQAHQDVSGDRAHRGSHLRRRFCGHHLHLEVVLLDLLPQVEPLFVACVGEIAGELVRQVGGHVGHALGVRHGEGIRPNMTEHTVKKLASLTAPFSISAS